MPRDPVFLTAILLVLALVPFVLFLRKDPAAYRAFKALTETRDRQRLFRVWTLKSFLLFGCSSIAALAVLGRLSALVTLPPEFRRLSNFFSLHSPSQSGLMGFFLGIGAALLFGIFVGILAARRKKKKQAEKPVVLGDISPLLPRNWAEIAHGALLSLNAGFSEELYFRLLLPLLLAILIGHAVPAFALAALLFGVAHLYQGPIGVIATTAIGLLMTFVYLFTGSLWCAMGAHAFLDLLALVIRPSVTRISAPQQTS